ncbi:hypothetical protein DEIPH_ctg011orf0059 [Deinococcus phoenicis]|uniref:Uncharacterized protein n=1 Tax=Deinococcus phoenicis TaxID=1476583 RepID=A0A016QSY6_9DEIO|nr:hypothetical protein DEIPH_ctg011orf0059 [Deinococcus phoenicis]
MNEHDGAPDLSLGAFLQALAFLAVFFGLPLLIVGWLW